MLHSVESVESYRQCRMLLHELFAKFHDAIITQPSFLKISIGTYRCVAESTTRLPSSVIKPSNCNNLRILLVYSRHTDNRVFLRSSSSDLLSTQSSSTNMAARRFSCCASTVWNSLPSFVRTADSFTSFRSQLKTYMFARHL